MGYLQEKVLLKMTDESRKTAGAITGRIVTSKVEGGGAYETDI